MFNLIERYINRLSKEDIYNFGVKKDIVLSEEELDFKYNFIKKNWNQMLSNPNLINFERFKNNYSSENLIKLEKLYKEYYSKYHKYL